MKIFITKHTDPYTQEEKSSIQIRTDNLENAKEIAAALEVVSGRRREPVIVSGELVAELNEDGELIRDYETDELGPAFFD